MKEFLEQKFAEVRSFAKDRITAALEEELQRGDLQAVGRKIVEILNVEPVYTAAGAPGFQEQRAKLESEPGIVIANHPGYIDPFVIMSVIPRPDLLVMVHPNIYKALERRIGAEKAQQRFVPASPQMTVLRSVLDRSKGHIRAGGLFLLFPTGMMNDEFKGAFGNIVSDMRPEDMVYSFHIDEGDSNRMQFDIGRYVGVASGMLLPDVGKLRELANINRKRKPLQVRIDERYSNAQEWQALETGPSRKDIDRKLSGHFEEQFS